MDDCGTRTRRQRKRGGVDPEHMERAVAAERRRLSRELHDSVSQALYSIALGAQTARTLLDRDPSRVAEPLEYVLTQAERCLAEMRALIFDLRPESLETEGLVAALRRQAAAFTARHQIECFALLEEEPDLPAAAKEALYRIAQEALQNAAKHSGANAVGLRLRFDKDNVTLEIEDNGRGFDPAAQHPGHLGLHSMRERAIQLGGRLDIESNPNSYTRIRVRLPSPS
jgi:signal transduction histidine kinase